MKTSCLLAALSFLLLAGCNDSPPPGNANSRSVQAGTASGQAASSPRRAQKAADVTALNKAIEKFYLQEGRFPTNLVELALRDYIALIPVLPADMAWDYDTNTGVASIIKTAGNE